MARRKGGKQGPGEVVTKGGQVLQVDAEDVEAVAGRSWYGHPSPETGRVYWATPAPAAAGGEGGEGWTYLGQFVLGLHGKGSPEARRAEAGGKGELQAHGRSLVLHLDGDLANAQKGNLRAIRLGTAMHRREVPKRDGVSSSRFIGVSQLVRKGDATGKWVAKITTGYESVYLGLRGSEEEAAELYDEAALQIHGPAARTNFPQED